MVWKGKLMIPKDVNLFHVGIAKAYYISTGSTRIVCSVAVLVSNTALVLSLSQGFFRLICTAAARVPNKL